MALPEIPVRGASPCLEASCSICCHDTEMLLTNEDVMRLSLSHPGGHWWQEEDGDLILQTRDAPPVAGHAGRPCWFLGTDGRCTVHDERPAGCRLYPAVWDVDLRRARTDDEVCPHTDGFKLDRFTDAAVRRLVTTLDAERQARLQRG